MPDGAGGNVQNGEDTATQGNFTRPHLSRSGGEKSVGGNIDKDPTAGEKSDSARASKGQQGARSKSCTLLSADAPARHDALVTAKALMQFPPSTDNPKVYQEWWARLEGLLHFADGGPRCEPAHAPTVDSPGAEGDETREPRDHPRGERPGRAVPPQANPPAAGWANHDCDPVISVESSSTRNRDLRNDLKTPPSTRMHAPASNVVENAIDGKIGTTTSPRAASPSPPSSARPPGPRRPPLRWHHQSSRLPAAILACRGSRRGR